MYIQETDMFNKRDHSKLYAHPDSLERSRISKRHKNTPPYKTKIFNLPYNTGRPMT